MQKRHAEAAKTIQRPRIQAKCLAKQLLGPVELPSLKTKHSERFKRLEILRIAAQHLLVETDSLWNPARPAELLCITQQLLGHKQILPCLLVRPNAQLFGPYQTLVTINVITRCAGS